MKQMKRRAVLLIVSAVILVIVGIAITYGWYTKMVAVTGVEFEAAQWEFNANMQMDTIYVNAYRYYQVNPDTGEEEFGRLAAPGTQGFIPINMSAESSDTDVMYEIIVDKTTMGKEFQDRIRFYRDPACTEEMLSNEDQTALTGYIHYHTSEVIKVYWKWVYEMTELYPTASPEEQDEWNAFDTRVGKNPELYENLMDLKLIIRATQSAPQRETGTGTYSGESFISSEEPSGTAAWWEYMVPSGASPREREIYGILAESCTNVPDYVGLLGELGMEYAWGWYDPFNGWLVCRDGFYSHEPCGFDGHAFSLDYPMSDYVRNCLSPWMTYPTFYDSDSGIYYYPCENITVESTPYSGGRWLQGIENPDFWYNPEHGYICYFPCEPTGGSTEIESSEYYSQRPSGY